MKNLLAQEEILASWSQCIKAGISSTLNGSLRYVTGKELEDIVDECELLISVFERTLKKMKDLMAGAYCFILANKKQILVKKREI